MSNGYFTDREYGQRPAVSETVDERVWGAILTLIEMRFANGAFGYRFPEQCLDGYDPCGCNKNAFAQLLQAELPDISWPLSRTQVPETPIVLDLLEFCAKAVGEPIQGSYHSYHRHYHLRWDREVGLNSFITEVNLLFQRNGVAFKLDAEGFAQRILPQPIAHTLGRMIFRTGDVHTDDLLEHARSRFLSPKLDDRRDATEKLWDAFERIKTLEVGANKKAQADALLDCAADIGSQMRLTLAEEAKMLTLIGNKFRIRHSEIDQEAINRSAQLDWLFVRLFSFLQMLLLSSGRSG